MAIGVAAALVGGTALTGGPGGLGRPRVGVLMVTVLWVGGAVVGMAPAYEPIAYGALVVSAVAVTADRDKRSIVK